MNAGQRGKSRARRLIVTLILISVGVHLMAAFVAGVVVVARYLIEPPAEFVARKDVRLPAQEREHSMNMAAADSMAAKPSFTDKLQSLRPSAFALPDLPKAPMEQMLPLDASALVSETVSALTGSGGMGAGTGSGAGGSGSLGTGVSFLGLTANGRRILLLFDVSSSVANKASQSGMPLTRIKEETITFLDQMPINARFGLIQFTQNYKAFRTELVAATDQNRQAAREWVEQEWVETGNMPSSRRVVTNPRGLAGVLELAARLQPDVIFLITDASFQWRASGQLANIPWDEIARLVKGPLQSGGGCMINLVGFQMKPDDKKEAGAIVRGTRGKLREIE